MVVETGFALFFSEIAVGLGLLYLCFFISSFLGPAGVIGPFGV